MPPHREPSESLRAILSRMPPKGQTIAASTAAAGWAAIHGVLLEGRIEDFFDFSSTTTLVMFVLRGETPMDWRRGNRYSRLALRPGDVLVAPADDCNRMRTHQATEVLCDFIERDRLIELVVRGWPPGTPAPEVVEGHRRDEGELWELGRRLADRLRAQGPGAGTYAEALQVQIALHLLWEHSTLARPEDVADAVADPRLGPVIRYIRDNLSEDVSLEALASVAGLSPNYFLAAFREATGETPHRYVTELRVARACELLRDPHRPITEVSLAVGFSSQSHLTEVFRRTMKTTPAAYRRSVLGLDRNGDDPDR